MWQPPNSLTWCNNRLTHQYTTIIAPNLVLSVMAVHTKFYDFVYFTDWRKIGIKSQTCLNEDSDIGHYFAQENTLILLWRLKINFYQNWVMSGASYLRTDTERLTKWWTYKLLPRDTYTHKYCQAKESCISTGVSVLVLQHCCRCTSFVCQCVLTHCHIWIRTANTV
jgi:hypothetical protein